MAGAAAVEAFGDDLCQRFFFWPMFNAEVVVDTPCPGTISFRPWGSRLQHNKKRPIVEWAPVIRNSVVWSGGLGLNAHGV